MDGATLYDTDVIIWAEQQAAALRRLAIRRDLPNDIDLQNVAEEIEDVGKSELRAVESLAVNILSHLILLWADPEAPSIRGWRGEIAAWRGAIRRRMTPSMPVRIDMEPVWQDAIDVACAKLSDAGMVERAGLTREQLASIASPLDLNELTDRRFDSGQAIARLPAR
jgi:hypothetical protein